MKLFGERRPPYTPMAPIPWDAAAANPLLPDVVVDEQMPDDQVVVMTGRESHYGEVGCNHPHAVVLPVEPSTLDLPKQTPDLPPLPPKWSQPAAEYPIHEAWTAASTANPEPPARPDDADTQDSAYESGGAYTPQTLTSTFTAHGHVWSFDVEPYAKAIADEHGSDAFTAEPSSGVYAEREREQYRSEAVAVLMEAAGRGLLASPALASWPSWLCSVGCGSRYTVQQACCGQPTEPVEVQIHRRSTDG